MTTVQHARPLAGQGTPVMCPAPPDHHQLFAWMKAEASKRGIQVRKTQQGYLVHQWGLNRHCDSLDDLAFVLGRMGVSLP